MLHKYKDMFEKIEAAWSKKTSPLEFYRSRLKTKKINIALKPGVEENIFEMTSGGRIVGIEFGAGSDILQTYRKVMLTARWDNETKNALDLPLHDFFGFAYGQPAMQSVLLGSGKTKLYSYLPMPFDKSAVIKLKYDKVNTSDPNEPDDFGDDLLYGGKKE
ncbi:MAG: DUF2961 domain-containing protein [Cyclobacteriaceae bacterium]|nr:DUF2961 domain-containing protein [Cyclobacteriaceae bacterium]